MAEETGNAAMDELKIQKRSNTKQLKQIPIVKRARTKNLAFIFNLAARLIQQNNQLVICYNNAADQYFMSINEVVYLKKLYSYWLLAYIKGYTNEKPTLQKIADRSGYTPSQVAGALNNRTSRGYTLTYNLLKQWGYIYE